MTEIPSDSNVHPAIHEWIRKGGDLTIDGQRFLEADLQRDDREGRIVYRGFFPDGGSWHRVAASIKADDPLVDVWVTKGYGRGDISTPTFVRSASALGTTTSSTTVLIDAEGRGSHCVHGQGATTRHAVLDCTTGELGSPSPAMTRSKWTPQDGNQTGAHWKYMQAWTPINAEIDTWRTRLYPQARYGGRFVTAKGHTFWSEAIDRNALHLQNGTHFHRETDNHWIRYTKPSEPWQDRGDMRTADDQHFSVYDATNEAFLAFPWDEGLRWEVAFGGSRFLLQIPAHYDHVSYSGDPSQARARGRNVKFAVKSSMALQVAGFGSMALAVYERMLHRLRSQIHDWREDQRNGGLPWPHFEGWGKHSPAEIGIWFWGLTWAEWHIGIVEPKSDLLPELALMRRTIARFCFDCFWLRPDGSLELDYFVSSDFARSRSPNDLNRYGSGGEHLAIMAARHAVPVGSVEEAKMRALMALEDRTERRFRWAGGWQPGDS